jgi:hypothetical protein
MDVRRPETICAAATAGTLLQRSSAGRTEIEATAAEVGVAAAALPAGVWTATR